MDSRGGGISNPLPKGLVMADLGSTLDRGFLPSPRVPVTALVAGL